MMNVNSLKSLNEIDYKYWIDFWNKWPNGFGENQTQEIKDNNINLRPKEYKPQDLVKQLNSVLKFNKDMEVLDVGCGNGEEMALISPKVKKIYGIDRSEAMINKAKEYLTGVKNCVLRKMDAVEIVYEPNSFDAVYSIALIQYLDKFHIVKYVQDMLSVVRSGGKILIGDILPPDAKYQASNCTQIPKEFWGDIKTGETHWDNAKLVSIINSTYEDRYHVVLVKK